MRCEDCFDELPPQHWVVYEPTELDDVDDDEKHLCADCAGWYRTAQETKE